MVVPRGTGKQVFILERVTFAHPTSSLDITVIMNYFHTLSLTAQDGDEVKRKGTADCRSASEATLKDIGNTPFIYALYVTTTQ